jgi:NAD(P)-dependent dehydrogenase (short-subunit alcohol dehydrogenase family)
MLALTGKKVVVIGGSRGVGRRIVEAASRNGARVLAVARQEVPLKKLAEEVEAVQILPLDATDDGAPAKVFGALQPDILVLCGGAFPPAAPLHQQSWQQFAVNWDSDVRIAFHFLKAALSQPLRARELDRSDFLGCRTRRFTQFGRLCRRQAHTDVHGEL